MSAGGYYSLALKSDGTLWAWGNNDCGQLGDGTDTDRWSPVPVPGLTDVASVSAGGWHSLALCTTSVPPPYTLDDLISALKLAGGLAATTAGEALRLDVETSTSGVTITDAAMIARKVVGLDVNP